MCILLIGYGPFCILQGQTAFEVKSNFRFEISDLKYISCHGNFLATCFLQMIETDRDQIWSIGWVLHASNNICWGLLKFRGLWQIVVKKWKHNLPHWSSSLLLIWGHPLSAQSSEGIWNVKTIGCLPPTPQCEQESVARECLYSRPGSPLVGRGQQDCFQHSLKFGQHP